MKKTSSCVVVEKDFKEEKVQKIKKAEPKTIIKNLKVKEEKKVHWSEDTVDNEHFGLKKSKSNIYLHNKVCCIYKKPRLNPDDTSSDSCSSCDEKGKNAYERPNHYDRKNKV